MTQDELQQSPRSTDLSPSQTRSKPTNSLDGISSASVKLSDLPQLTKSSTSSNGVQR